LYARLRLIDNQSALLRQTIMRFSGRRPFALAIAALTLAVPLRSQEQNQDGFRFRTGVELINVTATVTDASGHFVGGLSQQDFTVYEDGKPVELSHFSAERVPISLGIVLDTSASMAGDKLSAARAALDRFLLDLLGPGDEAFLYRFDDAPRLVEGWTTDLSKISAEMRNIRANGATSLYDAVAEALPLLDSGKHRKKALLVISDGTDLKSLERKIRESDALIYAIGIDAQAAGGSTGGRPEAQARYQRRRPMPMPFPQPPSGGRTPPHPPAPPGVPPGAMNPRGPKDPIPDEPPDPGPLAGRDRVDAAALRDITDESGGRTEIVRDPRDLAPTTSRIADELSRQYFLGYQSRAGKDGAWHVIRVETRDKSLHVRARRGYVAD
jgi:VWFA-related protein